MTTVDEFRGRLVAWGARTVAEATMRTTYRRIEWASALAMMLWGLALLLPGDSLAKEPEYWPLLWAGWREEQLGAVLLTASALWCAGLWINGRFAPTPLMRIAGALTGATFWSGLATMVIVESVRTGVPIPTAAPYIVFGLFDTASAYHAGRDLVVENRRVFERLDTLGKKGAGRWGRRL